MKELLSDANGFWSVFKAEDLALKTTKIPPPRVDGNTPSPSWVDGNNLPHPHPPLYGWFIVPPGQLSVQMSLGGPECWQRDQTETRKPPGRIVDSVSCDRGVNMMIACVTLRLE
ncbi:hypothetical protein ACOMHN_016396 [Nucella lapillus]